MAYVRGNAADYDRWAAAGLKGWSFADVLPYFRRSERWEGPGDFYRGTEGPLAVRRSRYADPLVNAWLEAAAQAGHTINPDYNGRTQEGFSVLQSTSDGGRRCSAADAYLRPALRRPNLEVRVNVTTARVVLEGNRAVGVEVITGSGRESLRANREVILATGAINTPQVMMLSGIGDPAQLQAAGVRVQVPLSGVGANLQDHASTAVEYDRAGRGPFHKLMRLDQVVRHLAQAYFFGTGPATDLPSGWTAFIKTDSSLPVPDVQLLFRAVPLSSGPHLAPFTPSFKDGFACRAVLLRPQSRGRVELASSDPRAPVRIIQNLLSTEGDRKTLRDALRIVREVGRQPALKPYVGTETAPAPAETSDEALDRYIRRSAATAHHPLGTCRMGGPGDEMAVVDDHLRVRGVNQLRIVDASVMPGMVGGNINAAVIMIAERASDLILGKPPLAPASAP
jgi:choline dehydrogenase/4-pyridoxate dehydrogenase